MSRQYFYKKIVVFVLTFFGRFVRFSIKRKNIYNIYLIVSLTKKSLHLYVYNKYLRISCLQYIIHDFQKDCYILTSLESLKKSTPFRLFDRRILLR